MGKAMSVAVNSATKKVKRFNVENRAQKVISQDKPTPAPTFKSNKIDLERVLREYPDLAEKQGKKDPSLDTRLKQVFVTSTDTDLNPIQKVDPTKPLPLNRKPPQETELGFQEIIKVSRGRCTLKQAIKFISDHQASPEEWTASKIANDYKLKQENVDNILMYYRAFQIHIPAKGGKTKKILVNEDQSKETNLLEDSFKDADRRKYKQ